jgi:PAS domain S-box-containing protein
LLSSELEDLLMARKPTYGELEQRIKEFEQEAAKRRSAEEALRESEKRLSQIVQGNPIPTFVIDNNHIMTHCNRAYENLTGISENEVIGTGKHGLSFYSEARPVMADLIVDNAAEEIIARYYHDKYRRSVVTEGGYEAEDFFKDLGENGKWIFFTAAPLKDAEGNITGAIETLQDITELKMGHEALRQSERRYRNLLDFVSYPIVLFSLDGAVSYVNPAFTETFGWTLQELEGETVPFVPPDLKQETLENIRRLFEEKVIMRLETRRTTKDGRLLDVVIRAAMVYESEDKPSAELVMLRDITHEKRIARNNETMLRISMALPEYPDLEGILDYITGEVKRLLDTEGALVILLDAERQELFFLGASYDDRATQKRIKEIRFPLEQLVAGKVIKTGKPIIVNDTSKDPELHMERDKKLGYQTRNLLLVPLRSSDRIIGVLCAINKKEGIFEQTEVEILSMIAGAVALSVENARFSEDLKKAYREVTSLNRAKDKVINHLSHELKTPASVLSGCLKILAKKLELLPEETWKPTMDRAQRNLNRILEIQDEVDDIMQDKQYKTYDLLSMILDQSTDELETLIAEELGESSIIERIRKRVEEIFGPKEIVPKKIFLNEFVTERLDALRPLFSHRRVEIISRIEPTDPIYIPLDPLQKVVDGLIKNAVENTPDNGKIELIVIAHKKDGGVELVVTDSGVGVPEEDQGRIFEGFFTTQDTMTYSSKRPFDFGAGGKGADLLRMKIFSERYNFKISMASSRCRFIEGEGCICPGNITECDYCETEEDCRLAGGTIFSLYFPPASKRDLSSGSQVLGI